MISAQASTPATVTTPRPMVRDRFAATVLTTGIVFGLLADWLFFRKTPGISYLLFAVAGLCALAALARVRGVGTSRSAWLLAVPVLFFAGAVAVRAESGLRVLNIAASLGVLAVLAYAVAGPSWVRLPLIGYPLAAARAAIEAFLRTPVLAATSFDLTGTKRADHSRWLPVLRGLLLALPLVLLFAGLFASADLVFNRHLAGLLSIDLQTFLTRLMHHAIYVLLATCFVAGGLAFCLRRAWASDSRILGLPTRWFAGTVGLAEDEAGQLRRVGRGLMDEGVICRPWASPRLGVVEAVIVLLAVDLLFLTFVLIQATYLFGGQANIALEGFTYADYARRGFFELVAVGLLAMGLALGLLQLVRRGESGGYRLFQTLLSALVVLVMVVLASAGQRLTLYEAAYGFTTLRLYSHVFMAVLAGVFAWLLVTIWWRPERFAVGAFVAMIAFVATLDVINPDAVIVRENVARYVVSGNLDSAYLGSRSLDAVPALAAALPTLHGTAREETRATLLWHAANLTGDAPEPWQSWNLGRERARAAVANVIAPGATESLE